MVRCTDSGYFYYQYLLAPACLIVKNLHLGFKNEKIFIILSLLNITNITLAAEKTVSLHVPAMTCPICPFTVEKALKGVDGVTTVNVSFDQKTTATALTAATKNAGYPSTVKN
ncbi:mercuric transport protein periplasmic component [Psychromonas ingrahamii 37]|uniref:Mercuric transport protein periplasmic component n=1 Tax=Psychromonas ingrahamii (strain DSM 17664 / CCUG 51855 / 37) TaxID=357804 RepID=A1SW49_PSYIN|nr:mercuric transport protein periplasmic component [Psychromonas ingrahamii 37]